MPRPRKPISLKQRFHREWAIVFGVFMLLILGVGAVDVWLDVVLVIPCCGVPFIAFVLYVFAITFRWKRLCRQAAAADGLLCPSCRYSLRGLAAEDPESNRELHCPECGYATTRRAMVEHWDLLPPPPTNQPTNPPASN